VEGPAEDSLGGGVEGGWEVEEPVEDPGPPGGREMRAGGTGLPLHHGCGKAGAGRGGGRRRERGVGAGGAGVVGRAGSGGGGARRWGNSTFPAHARLHGVRRKGLGSVSFVFRFPFPFSLCASRSFSFLL